MMICICSVVKGAQRSRKASLTVAEWKKKEHRRKKQKRIKRSRVEVSKEI